MAADLDVEVVGRAQVVGGVDRPGGQPEHAPLERGEGVEVGHRGALSSRVGPAAVAGSTKG